MNRVYVASFTVATFFVILFGSLVFGPALAAPQPNVTICHTDPDGDGAGLETLEVNGHSVAKHLAKHPGDHLGACFDCGDGFTDPPTETCDDGANNGLPGFCNNTCDGVVPTAVCGNNVKESGEECDDGNNVTEECEYSEEFCTVCASDCTEKDGATSFCGDEIVDVANGEQCDGKNLNDMTCGEVPAGDFNLEVNLLGNGQGNVKGYLDGGAGPGELACKPVSCTFDTTGCFPD